MAYELKLHYLAPIPVGHRVQVIHAQRWTTPLFGGQPQWEADSTPILVDLETSVVYAGLGMESIIVTVPLGFTPASGYAVAQVAEGKVVGCLCVSGGGTMPTIHTRIHIEPAAQGYRS